MPLRSSHEGWDSFSSNHGKCCKTPKVFIRRVRILFSAFVKSSFFSSKQTSVICASKTISQNIWGQEFVIHSSSLCSERKSAKVGNLAIFSSVVKNFPWWFSKCFVCETISTAEDWTLSHTLFSHVNIDPVASHSLAWSLLPIWNRSSTYETQIPAWIPLLSSSNSRESEIQLFTPK